MKEGYQMLIDRIKRRPIIFPEGLSDRELLWWTNGYEACFRKIISIIEEEGNAGSKYYRNRNGGYDCNSNCSNNY